MGSDDAVQPGAKVNESLWKEFRHDVEARKGSVRGHLRTELENALREYLRASEGGDTHDRLRRIENQIDAIADGVTDLSDDEGEKRKKTAGVSSTTKKRLRSVNAQIEREAGDAATVHESVINHAIEDNAGSSEPTLRRYKEMLKQRRMAFENPSGQSSTWFVDDETFVRVVESNFPEITNEVADEYGIDWYDQMVDEVFEEDDGPKGFQ